MYGFFTNYKGTVAEARQATIEALTTEGFGVLTEIDVAKTLKEKLGIDRKAYHILGACQPGLAKQALEEEPDIGLLLPCNVIVRQEDNDTVSVGFIDPEAMLSITGREDLKPFAQQVKQRLKRVCDTLGEV